MTRAQWFFLLALAAAAAIVLFRPRPADHKVTVSTTFTLPAEPKAQTVDLPPEAQTHGVASTGGLRTEHKKKKAAAPPVPAPSKP